MKARNQYNRLREQVRTLRRELGYTPRRVVRDLACMKANVAAAGMKRATAGE